MGKRNTYYPSTNHTVKSTGEEILTQERKKTMKEFLTFVNNVIYQGARAHTHGKKKHWLLWLRFLYQVCYSRKQNRRKEKAGGEVCSGEGTNTKSSDLAGLGEKI